MELEKAQASAENGKSGAKKAYRKPSVQVYGQLADVTNATTNPATHKTDGIGWAGHNRT
jgi:hypothetical protein